VIDIRLVRTEPDRVKAALARKGVAEAEIDEIIALDSAARSATQQQEEIRARVKDLSKQVGQARRDGDANKAEELSAQSRELGEQERTLAETADQASSALRAAILVLPNLPADEAAPGSTEDDNPLVREGGPGIDSYADHQRVPHWEIAEELGLLDLGRAAKLSGAMFPLFRGDGALLSRSLIQLFLDRATSGDSPFEEMRPPLLVRTDTITATGHLPKFADDAYQLERDDLWAIPTAEVPLTSMARDEILSPNQLPWKMCAFTPCFRREAGSAGKDTRGLLRSHEFDKVELMAYTAPDAVQPVFMEILDRAVALCDELGLTWRVIEICAGELGQSHARQFDVEVWSPGTAAWLEVSSVSWFSDYQARRANVRYRPAEGSPAFVHTTNGSALAVPRVWAALVEVNRRTDGKVDVPEVLRRWTGKEVLGG
jgi:seryl-tRNA synthetase